MVFWFLPVDEYKDESGCIFVFLLFIWWLFVICITLMFFKSCVEVAAERGRELRGETVDIRFFRNKIMMNKKEESEEEESDSESENESRKQKIPN